MPGRSRADRVEAFTKRVSHAVVSCENCEPWADGAVVWVNGAQTSISDVLNNTEVPEEDSFRDEVLSGTRCSGCGSRIGKWDDVGVRLRFEVEHEEGIKRAVRRFGRKLSSFAAFLEHFPMLGAAHPVGRKLLKDIGKFPRVTLEPSTWFRARRLESGRPFTPDDMRVPDPNSVLSPGRFNHLGQAHWYLADSELTAVSEVIDEGDDMAWVQRWKAGSVEPVLDLVDFGADDPSPLNESTVAELPLLATAMIFGGHLNRPADRKAGWKPEYFVPHYMADAAKKAGFAGIRFKSTKAYGANLVIFSAEAPVSAEGSPEVFSIKKYLSKMDRPDPLDPFDPSCL